MGLGNLEYTWLWTFDFSGGDHLMTCALGMQSTLRQGMNTMTLFD